MMRGGARLLGEGKWLKLVEIEWKDRDGKWRKWEMAERTTRTKNSKCDAVAIFPRLYKSSDPNFAPRTVLVIQYRPPLNSRTIENPAGLIDENETPEMAALRELKEETGYVGTVVSVTAPIFSDPGISNTSFSYVFVDCDLDDPRNCNPKASLEDGEDIETVIVEIAKLLQSIESLAKQQNLVVDAKCYSLAMGLSMSAKSSL